MPSGPHDHWLVSRLWSALPSALREAAPALLVLPGLFSPTGDTLNNGTSGPQWPTASTVVFVAVSMVIVALRRRFPRAAAGAALGSSVAVLALNGPTVAYQVMLVIVVFSVARHCDRRTTFVVAGLGAVLVGGAAVLFLPEAWGNVRSFVQVVGVIGFAAAAGDAARSRQAYIDTITERALRAEQTKESEARRRVAEERLAIARDLHDVMAHQIAVINMHANVASQALPTRPDDAERSLVTIREAGRTVLGEIAGLLQVLRSGGPGEPASPADRAPVPGLAELDTLVATFARSGLEVEVRTVGREYALPETMDLVAYRVIQEGLTNAQKHGLDASALLQIEYEPDQLEVTVTNTVAGSKSATGSSGHGLTGARERVAAVHGTLDATYGPGPVHRLTAKLPRP